MSCFTATGNTSSVNQISLKQMPLLVKRRNSVVIFSINSGLAPWKNSLRVRPPSTRMAVPHYSQLLSVIFDVGESLYAATITGFMFTIRYPPLLWMASSSHHQVTMKLMGYYVNYLLLVSTKRGILKPRARLHGEHKIQLNIPLLLRWYPTFEGCEKVSIWSILIIFLLQIKLSTK